MRVDPWPLRVAPPPPTLNAHCPADSHLLVRIGPRTLRLEPGILRETKPWTLRQNLPACPEGQTITTSRIYLTFGSFTGFKRPSCIRPGQPLELRPECDQPLNRNWYLTFVLGLPADIELNTERSYPPMLGDEDVRLAGLSVRRLTPLGHEMRLRSDGRGPPTYILPRLGDEADTLGPQLVQCDSFWEWPRPPLPPGSPSPMTQCRVLFSFPDGVRVQYRFHREIFDEPDWAALDLRVRQWIVNRTVGPSAN